LAGIAVNPEELSDSAVHEMGLALESAHHDLDLTVEALVLGDVDRAALRCGPEYGDH